MNAQKEALDVLTSHAYLLHIIVISNWTVWMDQMKQTVVRVFPIIFDLEIKL